MQTNGNPTGTYDPSHQNSKRGMRASRLQMLMIFIVCAAPVVGGTIAFNIWNGGRTTNYGELLAPRKVDLAGRGADRQPLALSAHQGKWRLVLFDGAECGEGCRQKLFYTRQIRLAQGRDQARIERIWVIDNQGTPDPKHAPLYADATLITLESPDAAAQFLPGSVPRDHIYLVDPLGFLMMRYPAQPDHTKMIKDLQRLLKYSRSG